MAKDKTDHTLEQIERSTEAVVSALRNAQPQFEESVLKASKGFDKEFDKLERSVRRSLSRGARRTHSDPV